MKPRPGEAVFLHHSHLWKRGKKADCVILNNELPRLYKAAPTMYLYLKRILAAYPKNIELRKIITEIEGGR